MKTNGFLIDESYLYNKNCQKYLIITFNYHVNIECIQIYKIKNILFYTIFLNYIEK